jgi:hypothetical protein
MLDLDFGFWILFFNSSGFLSQRLPIREHSMLASWHTTNTAQEPTSNGSVASELGLELDGDEHGSPGKPITLMTYILPFALAFITPSRINKELPCHQPIIGSCVGHYRVVTTNASCSTL